MTRIAVPTWVRGCAGLLAQQVAGPRSPGRRGSALALALALIMAMTLLVAAMQLMVVSQLKVAKTERNSERALQAAESGLNAYLNRLANGTPANPPSWWPPANLALDNTQPVPTIVQFKTGVRNGTYTLTRYPTATSQSGFYVAPYGALTAATGYIVAYGWSNGAVRRIKVGVIPSSIFDWAALWGIQPSNAWTLTGGATVVGGFGGEGAMTYGANNFFYDGPAVRAGPNAQFLLSGVATLPPVGQSTPNNPSGHVGTGVPANPMYRTYARSLGLPTADQAANQWASDAMGAATSQGVEYFRTHNDDATGIRYLATDKSGNITELPGPPTNPSPANAANDYVLTWPNSVNGLASGQSFYGIHLYPGTYYFTNIGMQPNDVLRLRTFNDADRSDPSITGDATNWQPSIPGGGPANPNQNWANLAAATNRNIRFFIGHASVGSDAQTRFEHNVNMEYSKFASRFRVYGGNSAGVFLHGSNASPALFNVNMLVYNQAANGSYYGSVTFQSATYLRGSLLAWTASPAGSTTIEKQAPEVSPNDRLTFKVVSWQELQ